MSSRCAVLSILLAALAPAVSASAATSVTMSLSSTTALPGGTITITVTATSNGGETDDTVFGAILYDGSKVVPGVQSQLPLSPGDWTQGALTCTTERCVAFSQIRSAGATAVGITNAVIATQTYTVQPDWDMSAIKFSWQTSPTGQRLDWFGITSTSQSYPGGVYITVIPEPATAALLGLGLLGLGLAVRRSSQH